MYKIALCEDEQKEQEEIAYQVKKILENKHIDCDISCYQSGEELFQAIQDGMNFHLLLLDVVLEGMDGIALAAKLRGLQNTTAIVFLSWYKEMALQGYEVEAVRYLAKPIQEEKLQEALLFCYEKQLKKEILLPTEYGKCRISISDIMYAEAQGRGVKLILTDGQMEVKFKISELGTLLFQSNFVLCHRAYLVNCAFIQYLRRYEIELKNGKILPVSKYRFPEIEQKLVAYLSE